MTIAHKSKVSESCTRERLGGERESGEDGERESGEDGDRESGEDGERDRGGEGRGEGSAVS